MAHDGHEPLLKKSRWCVLKRKENLTAKQQHRLRDLLRRKDARLPPVRACPASVTPGFAILLTDSTNLGLATLITEDEEGHYEPVSVVSSISEAREIAASDLKGRMCRLERGDDPGFCPYSYKVWAAGIEGSLDGNQGLGCPIKGSFAQRR
jgi:hypothetical protein